MNDAIEEFLTENMQRRFPLREDGDVTCQDGVLEDSVLLDFRGWHRDRPELTPRLSAIIGPDGTDVGSFIANTGFVSFYFSAGSGGGSIIWVFKVSVIEGSFPVSLISTVDDTNYAGVFRGVARASFGGGVSSIPADAAWIFTSALLEPGLVIEQYRGQVDSILLVHDVGDDELVGGDIELVGGYNTSVVPSEGGVRIVPSLGAGTLGRFIGAINPSGESKCSGVLMSVGGVTPDEKTRNLVIKGENGIEVLNFPESSRIVIRVAKPQFGGSVCS